MCLREASKLVQKVLHKTFNGQDNLYLHDDDALLNVPSKDSKFLPHFEQPHITVAEAGQDP
jgi:hypothetical protein